MRPFEAIHVEKLSFSIARRLRTTTIPITACDKGFPAIITNLLCAMAVLCSFNISEIFSVETKIQFIEIVKKFLLYWELISR